MLLCTHGLYIISFITLLSCRQVYMCMICVVQVLNVVIICCVSLFMYTTITSDGYTVGKLQCIIILYYHPLLHNDMHY